MDILWLVVGGGRYILAGGGRWWMVVDRGGLWWVVAQFSLTRPDLQKNCAVVSCQHLMFVFLFM